MKKNILCVLFAMAWGVVYGGSLSVAFSDITNYLPVATASLPEGWTSASIEIGCGEDGPFSAVKSWNAGDADLPESFVYTNEAAKVGVRRWYRLRWEGEDGGGTSGAVGFRRLRMMERDPGDLAQLREGVALESSLQAAYEDDGWRVHIMRAFDGNTGTFIAQASNSKLANPVFIRLRFPEKFHLGAYRFWNVDNFHAYTCHQLLGWAEESEDLGGWKMAPYFTATTGNWNMWHKVEIEDWLAERAVDALELRISGASSRLGEVSFFGWTDADEAASGEPFAPDGIWMEAVGGGVKVSWTAGVNAGAYRVERRGPGGEWAVAADGVEGLEFADAGADSAQTWFYRVAAVNGETGAYDRSVVKMYCPAGDGTGLSELAAAPFDPGSLDPGQVKWREPRTRAGDALVRVGAGETLMEGAEAAECGRYMVEWSGKLIVPVAGRYTFTVAGKLGRRFSLLRSSDKATLRDSEADLWTSTYNGNPSRAYELAAGEHLIVVAGQFKKEETGALGLYWSLEGSDPEPVPATQLKPDDMPNTDEFGEWKTVRDSLTKYGRTWRLANSPEGTFYMDGNRTSNTTEAKGLGIGGLVRECTGGFEMEVETDYDNCGPGGYAVLYAVDEEGHGVALHTGYRYGLYWDDVWVRTPAGTETNGSWKRETDVRKVQLPNGGLAAKQGKMKMVRLGNRFWLYTRRNGADDDWVLVREVRPGYKMGSTLRVGVGADMSYWREYADFFLKVNGLKFKTRQDGVVIVVR